MGRKRNEEPRVDVPETEETLDDLESDRIRPMRARRTSKVVHVDARPGGSLEAALGMHDAPDVHLAATIPYGQGKAALIFETITFEEVEE